MAAERTARGPGPGELCRKDGEYPLEDGLGSERTVTNSSQTVTGSINYDAFGNKVGSSGSSTDPYMFAQSSAYRSDGDAGLTHVGARYYDAQVGRFITRDTELDEHAYAYCDHDPVNDLDPDGHGPRKKKHVKPGKKHGGHGGAHSGGPGAGGGDGSAGRFFPPGPSRDIAKDAVLAVGATLGTIIGGPWGGAIGTVGADILWYYPPPQPVPPEMLYPAMGGG